MLDTVKIFFHYNQQHKTQQTNKKMKWQSQLEYSRKFLNMMIILVMKMMTVLMIKMILKLVCQSFDLF